MVSAGKCEVGLVRKNNEDSIFIYNTNYGCLPNLYIVADGMGGHNAGEIASNCSISTFCNYIHDNRHKHINSESELLDILAGGVSVSNNAIYEKSLSDENLCGMGTTFVAATFSSNKLLVVNVGDSRVYLIRNDSITQITHDHTFVMELVRQGKITKEEAINHPQRNILTRALGTVLDVEVDAHIVNLMPQDIILMCSDGVTTMLSDSEIKNIVIDRIPLLEKVDKILALSYEKGGIDNISIILIEE